MRTSVEGGIVKLLCAVKFHQSVNDINRKDVDLSLLHCFQKQAQYISNLVEYSEWIFYLYAFPCLCAIKCFSSFVFRIRMLHEMVCFSCIAVRHTSFFFSCCFSLTFWNGVLLLHRRRQRGRWYLWCCCVCTCSCVLLNSQPNWVNHHTVHAFHQNFPHT